MGLLGKIKEAAASAAESAKKAAEITAWRAVDVSRAAVSKVADTAEDLDLKGRATAAAGLAFEVSGNVVGKATDAIRDSPRLSETLVQAKSALDGAYSLSAAAGGNAYEQAAESVRNFDYEQLKQASFYCEKFNHYKDLGAAKATEAFRATFEVDKSTMEMVEEVRSRLPVPAKNVDDIFEQCRREAIRRAIASFGLGAAMADIDKHSEAKYANLSESYKDNRDAIDYAGRSHPNYDAMVKEKTGIQLAQVINGYDKDGILFETDAQVDHVISKKEIYQDPLLRVGTTGEEMADVINAPGNLAWADGGFNGSKGEHNLLNVVAKAREDSIDSSKLVYTIESSGREVVLDKNDVEEAYERANAARHEARVAAAVEIGATVARTGAVMAAQQVVGLIVIETIDIFIDEIKNLSTNGSVINESGWLQNTVDAKNRIQQRLAQRFEERRIWARARSGHRVRRGRRAQRHPADPNLLDREDAGVRPCHYPRVHTKRRAVCAGAH